VERNPVQAEKLSAIDKSVEEDYILYDKKRKEGDEKGHDSRW
jgi:hypothetical protein